MKFFHSLRNSLRARLFTGLAAMLLPLLAMGGGTYYSFQLLTVSLNEVVEGALGEMTPLSQLEVAVQKGRTAVHQFVHDPSEPDHRRIEALFDGIDRNFARSLQLPFGLEAKRKTLDVAYSEWLQGRRGVRDILALAETEQAPTLLPILKRIDGQFDRTVELLEAVHEMAEGEIAEELKGVDRVKRRIVLLNTALFLAGTGMVMGIGLLLARSILHPLRRMDVGLKRFADGELSYRFEGIGQDELGGLMKAFNAMAEDLEEDRQALRELSVRDPLTSLYNHREFYRLLRAEAERSRRYRHPLSLLMLDLDRFKKINDTYGHPVGDRVLKSVAEIIRRQLRQVDHVARYGGEEFAVILPETAESEAFATADRIRQAVVARPLEIAGTDGVSLTISIGLAVYPDDAAAEEDLVAKADQALYRAKESGRNRVCRSFPSEGDSGPSVGAWQ